MALLSGSIRPCCDSQCEHHRSRNGSRGDVNLEVSSMLPGMPGTTRSASGTRHQTVAVTWAGSPTPTLVNCLVSTCTTGLQSRPSALSAAWALDSAAASAAPGVTTAAGGLDRQGAPVLLGAGHGPAGATNFSTGAAATWLMLIARPGTKVGTWPVTLIWMVVGVLPRSVADGPSRYPEASWRANASAACGPAPGAAPRTRAASTPWRAA